MIKGVIQNKGVFKKITKGVIQNKGVFKNN